MAEAEPIKLVQSGLTLYGTETSTGILCNTGRKNPKYTIGCRTAKLNYVFKVFVSKFSCQSFR